MHRALRYGVALLVGAAATAGVAAVTPQSANQLILLVGIAQVYAVGTAIALRYPDAFRGSTGERWVSAAFAGVTTFGTLMLLRGGESAPNVATAALGWGLAAFGLVAGVAFEREREAGADGASSD